MSQVISYFVRAIEQLCSSINKVLSNYLLLGTFFVKLTLNVWPCSGQWKLNVSPFIFQKKATYERLNIDVKKHHFIGLTISYW